MRKLLTGGAIIIAVILALVGLKTYLVQAQDNQQHSDKVLDFYNWGDYIDPDLLVKFTKETGYQVNYNTFDSNEAMFTKIKQGGTSYDLTVPSDYTVNKMIHANLLEPLDYNRLVGMNNYYPRLLNQTFDPHNRYSIPYFWGTLGILYNKKVVSASSVAHWNNLWDSKFKDQILLVDSARDILGMTLISQDKSMNDRSTADLAAAQGKLTSLMPNVKAIVADELKMYMAQGEANIGITYSGEAAQAMAKNPDLAYQVPSEGSNEWFDNFVIPRNARHKDAAYAFINFMNQPQNAAQNAKYIGYATPNQRAYELLPQSVQNNRQFYPSQVTLDKLEVYQNLGQKWTEKYNDAFLEFKMTKR
ncbi:ABC transporter substrate-binding protein [Convivina intestini]|uniref:ABC transporter substrate-binding protein n=1 Tax=Convivina intestini TaxID=1505726 RepID=UPI00200C90AE|nr:ABC transporter substrate-binding protein [Convivina intestini]CAH1854179.1 Spermidine/putrescine-binding periplasmic protein [Convivina intestini]